MAYPIKIEGILLWGKKNGTLRIEELEQVSTPLDSILHLLRHFQQVPPGWKKRITEGNGLREEDILKELFQPGSWWNPKLEALNTPEKVIQFSLEILQRALRQDRTAVWIYRKGREVCYSSHLVSPHLKQELLGTSEPIGLGGVVSLKDLPPNAVIEQGGRKASSQEEPVTIKVVKVVPLPTTDRVVISLARKPSGEIRPWTIYPGTISPLLPTARQFPEEQVYNQAFWEEHALIK